MFKHTFRLDVQPSRPWRLARNHLDYRYHETTTSYSKPTKEFLVLHLNLPVPPLYVFDSVEAYNAPNRSLLTGNSGVYIWFCAADQRCYVGGTTNMNNRPFTHVRPKGPKAPEFDAAFKLHGKSSFYLLVQEFGLPTDVATQGSSRALEQIYLNCVPFHLQYNESTSSSMPKGSFVRTQEFKDSLSVQNSGVNNPNYGRTTSEATKQQQRERKILGGQSVPVLVTNIITGESVRYDSKHAVAVALAIPQSTVNNAFNDGHIMRRTWKLTRAD